LFYAERASFRPEEDLVTRSARALPIVCAIAFATAALVTLEGQGRGGPPAAGGRGGAGRGGAGGPGGRVGKIEQITLHGKSLEGNLEGDSPDRAVSVYLPPAYQSDQMRRFPVVYLLHGYGGRENYFTEQLATLQASGDRMAAAQGFSEVIVVTPNAYTLHGNSLYSSSPTTGDWEKFIAEDLVAYIDGHYRTLTARLSRGLAGHSAGGYGALRIGMKRPDVFGDLYVMSACCLDAATGFTGQLEQLSKAAESITTREQAETSARQTAMGPSFVLASSAAWSPNPSAPPLFLDLPMKGGTVRQDIIAKWSANAAVHLFEQHAKDLQRYYAFAMDVGLKDPLLAPNRQMHDALARLRVPHYYEEYDGDHTDRIKDRLEKNVLVFFSKNLVAPANPTSPQIKD
jgi:enterochelin esterase-like enzyme